MLFQYFAIYKSGLLTIFKKSFFSYKRVTYATKHLKANETLLVPMLQNNLTTATALK